MASGGITNSTWTSRVALLVHQIFKVSVEPIRGVEEFVPRVAIEVSVRLVHASAVVRVG